MSKRRNPWLIAIASFVSLAGFVGGQETMVRLPAKDLAQMFPPETLIYLGTDGASYQENLAKTGLGRLLADPRLARLKEAFQQLNEFAMADTEPALALLARMTRHLETNRFAFGLLSADLGQPPAEPGQPGVMPSVDAVFMLEGREEGASLLTDLDGMLSQAGLPESNLEQVSGHAFTARILPGAPVSIYYGQVEDRVYVATSARALTKVLVPGAQTLATAPAFAACRSKAGVPGPMLSEMYVNIPAIRSLALAALEQFGPPDLPPVNAILAAVGFDRVGPLFAHSSIQNGGFRGGIWLDCPRQGDGLPPLAASVLARVPAKSRFFAAGRCDLDGLRAWMFDILRVVAPPPAQEQMNEQLAAMEEGLGFTMKDFLSSMGTEYLIFEDAEMPGLLPSFVLELQPANPEQLQKCVRQLLGMASSLAAQSGNGAELRVNEAEVAGKAVTYLSMRGAPMPVTPAWCQDGDRLVMTLHLAHMEDLLLRRNPAQWKAITDNADFVRGRRQLPATFHGVSYLDSAHVLSWLYGTALPILQAGLQGIPLPIELDVSVLPAPRVIASHLFGDVEAWTRTEEGYHYVTHTSSGAPTGAIMAGGLIGFVAGFTMPTVARARGKAMEHAHDAEGLEEITNIGNLLTGFALDQDFQYPDQLERLATWAVENEVDVLLDSEHLEVQWVYRGQGKRWNPESEDVVVILHSRSPDENGMGAVYYSDGSVDLLEWSELMHLLIDQR